MNAIIIEVKAIPEDCYHCDFVDIETGQCKYAEIFIDHRTKPGKRYAGCPIESMPEYERLKERDMAKNPIIEGHDEQDYIRCPSCNEIIADNETPDEWRDKFCSNCGQRLDWSGEEEE